MKNDIVCILIIILFALPLLITNLSITPIQNWDEATNILVVSETKSVSVPWDLHYRGELFFEKPPLWYIFTATIVHILGDSTLSYRLVSVISMIGVLITLYYLGKHLNSRLAGVIAAFIFLSIPHLSIINAFGFSSHTIRSADLDMLQIFFILLGVYACLGERNLKHTLAIYVFSALAFLAKGPFGLLPVILSYGRIFFERKVSRDIYLQHGLGSLTFLLLTGPWYWYQAVTHGNEFIANHVHYHIIGRATTMLEGHEQPWFYYFELLIHWASGYFTLVLIIGIAILIWRKHTHLRITKDVWILTGSFILVLGILTSVQTKISWYAFYLYPFIALLCAWVCTKGEGLVKYLLITGAFLLCVVGYGKSLLFVLHTDELPNYCKFDELSNNEERARRAYEHFYGECDNTP